MSYLKSLLPILIVAGSLLNWALEHRWRDRRTTMHRRVRNALLVVVVLSAALSLVVTWIAQKDQQQQEQVIRDLQKESLASQSELQQLRAKATELGDLSKAELWQARHLASLDEPIKSMQLRLSLVRPMRYADALPFVFVLDMMDESETGFQKDYSKPWFVRYVVTPGGMVQGPGNLPLSSYKVRRSVDKSPKGSLLWVDGRDPISEIEIPFFDERPMWVTVRDLHMTGVEIYVEPRMVNILEKIQIVVNGAILFEVSSAEGQWTYPQDNWQPVPGIRLLWLRTKRGFGLPPLDVYSAIPRIIQATQLDVVSTATTMMTRPDVVFQTGAK